MTPPSTASTPFALQRDSFKTPPGPERKRPRDLPDWLRSSVIERFACLEDSDLESTPSTTLSRPAPTGGSQAPLLFTPLPGPQTRAAESEAFVTGYGGAAGGGKSYLEIGLAASHHQKSLIFRRHKEDVRDLWSKLRAMCHGYGRPNESQRAWEDLPGGRSVRLVGLQHEWDWMKYQGNEADYWAFDEAVQFSELSIRTLMAWCRSPDPEQRCRVVLGFNPPTTPEGEWIIDFFGPWLDDAHPDPAAPGELRWFARLDDADVECDGPDPFDWKGETVTPLSRTFFPARLEDNTILDATGYRAVLQGMPEPLRSQMLYGDFSVGRTDDPWQVIPTAWVRAAQDRWHANARSGPMTQAGVDVAQGGADTYAVARRYGTWFAEVEHTPGPEVPDAAVAAAHVTRVLAEGGVALIDGDGIGASTFHLARALVGERVRCYLGSAPSDWADAARVLTFRNVRAAAHWALREALDPSSGLDIALPPDRNLRAELCAARWERLPGGAIKLEAKEDIKERLGRSPDAADAVVMAWWSDPTQGYAAQFGTVQSMPSVAPGRVVGAGRGRR
jgi:hypothetical protein